MTFETTLHAAPGLPAPAVVGDLGRARFVIRDELPSDISARERLLDDCFGPARFLETCERLRAGRIPARGLALAAHDEDRLVATLRRWPVLAGPGDPRFCWGHWPFRATIVASAWRRHDRNRPGSGQGAQPPRRAAGRRRALSCAFWLRAPVTEGLTLPGWVDPARFLGHELAPGAMKDARGRVKAAAQSCSMRDHALRLPHAQREIRSSHRHDKARPPQGTGLHLYPP